MLMLRVMIIFMVLLLIIVILNLFLINGRLFQTLLILLSPPASSLMDS